MGWTNDDGKHEGYVADVLADGRVAVGSTAGGVLVRETTAADEAAGWVRRERYFPDAPEHIEALIPWESGLVTTWRVVCECGWTGSERPIQLTTEPDGYVHGHSDSHPEIEEAFRQEWKAHVAPDVTLAELGVLADRLRKIERELADQVARARTLGASWTEIGREAGLTRQGAQQRWGNSVLEPST